MSDVFGRSLFRETPGEPESEYDSLLRKIARVSDELLPLPQLGQIIGDKYRIEAQIGRGGMGAVFRATHVVSAKPVALKWMLRSGSNERARQRFLREARAAGRIHHPNVVDVYDVGQEGPCCYLVMELLHGEPLRNRLKSGALSVSEAVDLLLPAMRGVAAVHQAGVIHRDLKPDNIFLCKGADEAPREAKVLDFGISAVVVCTPDDPTLTEDGAVLGTPAYMSPEQLHDARDIDARSDVYSFGVILYEALTGRLPFVAESYPNLVLAVVYEQPKSPAELRSDLPPELAHIVMRALAKRREDRFPNIETFIDALCRHSSAARERIRPAAKSALRGPLAGLVFGAALVCFAAWMLPRTVPNLGLAKSAPKAAASRTSGETKGVAVPLHWPLSEPPASRADWLDGAAGARDMCFVTPPRASASQTSEPEPSRARSTQETSPPSPVASRGVVRRAAAASATQRGDRAPKTPDARVRVTAKPLRHVSCDPPYSIDAAGRIIFKLECL